MKGSMRASYDGSDMWRVCVDRIFTLKKTGEKAREKKRRMYVGFMDLEKVYDKVNREAPWKVLSIYSMGGKLLNGIKSTRVSMFTSPVLEQKEMRVSVLESIVV